MDYTPEHILTVLTGPWRIWILSQRYIYTTNTSTYLTLPWRINKQKTAAKPFHSFITNNKHPLRISLNSYPHLCFFWRENKCGVFERGVVGSLVFPFFFLFSGLFFPWWDLGNGDRGHQVYGETYEHSLHGKERRKDIKNAFTPGIPPGPMTRFFRPSRSGLLFVGRWVGGW